MRTGGISWNGAGISLLLSLRNTLEFKCDNFVCTLSDGSERLGHLLFHSLIQRAFKTNGDYFLLTVGVF